MIKEISQSLEAFVKQKLYPNVLTSSDMITLCIPRHAGQDYMVGLYLYDMAEDETQHVSYSQVVNGKRIFPSRVMMLQYVIFINEETRFGGYCKDLEAELLEKLIQLFHDQSEMMVNGELVRLQFINLSLENKIRFWQSLNKPLQPSLFIQVSPVPIASTKQEDVVYVKEVFHDIHQKKEEL